jgi:hypothetical protein
MQPALFAWLLGSAVASVLWYGALMVLRAANRHLRAASVFVLSSAAAIGVAVLMLVETGNLALLLMDATMAPYSLNAVARLLEVSPLASLLQAANPYPVVRLAFVRTHIR